MSPSERAALIARMDRAEATKEDRARYDRDLDARADAFCSLTKGR